MSVKVSFIPTRQEAPPVNAVALTPEQRSAALMACALLLDYPGDNFEEILSQVKAEAELLPPEVGQELREFCSWARMRGVRGVQEDYVDTFDRKRRCSLELTYYATGDTRQRGIALTVFSDLFNAVGFEPPHRESLPDYLPRVLELAARCEGEDLALVLGAIAASREGIEVLHAALLSLDSPWQKVVAALRMVLGEADGETTERMERLIRQGPPTELVGLDDSNNLPWPQLAPVQSDTANEG